MFLQTERLELLGPSEKENEASLNFLYRMYSDPRVMEHLGGPLSKEIVRERWENCSPHWEQHGFGPCVVRLKASGELVAALKLSEIEFEGEKVLEIGWMVLPELQRQGIAFEAIQACVRYARNRFPTMGIVAFPDTANNRSNRMCEKLGMVRRKEFSLPWLGKVFNAVYWRIGK